LEAFRLKHFSTVAEVKSSASHYVGIKFSYCAKKYLITSRLILDGEDDGFIGERALAKDDPSGMLDSAD
jgi:hypothetical protein